jgi:broad specificity phosphatase PhoE
MREQDFGNFQGTAQEMKAIWLERAKYGHFFYRIPHGESAADVYDRCSSFNETLFRQFSRSNFPQVLVLVTHGIWARVFLQRWFRWSVEYFEDLTNIPHCEWIILELTETHEDTNTNTNTNNLDHHDEHETRYHLKTVLKHWDDSSNDDGTSTTYNKNNSRDTLIYPYN